MTFMQLMDAVAKAANLEDGVHPEPDGSVCLAVDDFAVEFREIDGGRQVLMWAPLGARPAGDGGRLNEILLRGNFLGALTNGAVLSLSQDGENICLHRDLALAGLEPKAFQEAFEEFVKSAFTWQRLIADVAEEGDRELDFDAPGPSQDEEEN